MSTFNPPADIAQITLAKSSDVNAIKAATAIAFGLLPDENKLQRGTVNFVVDTGTTNSYVVAMDASITTYTDGLQVVFRPLTTNTGEATITLTGLGTKSIRLTNSDPIQAGDISAGAIIDVRYSTATEFFHLTPNSAIYAHDAGVSADAAAASAGTATTKAGEALSSANSASTSAGTATTKAAEALSSANSASSSAGTATTKAAEALSSANSASSSAGTATTKAGEALSSANSASTSAGTATTKAAEALSSAASAAASYDSFDDRYLGAKASDPTLDNDGNALLTGALYWNTTSSEMRVYSGSAWLTSYLPAAGYLALSGGTMTGPITFAANQTFTSNSGATAISSAVDISLTSTSTLVQAVAMTVDLKAVILPDATTISTKGLVYVIKNTGGYIFNVRNSAGNLITPVNIGQIAVIYLTDNSTSAGTWLIGNESTSSFLASIFIGTISTVFTASSIYISVTNLSATQALVTYNNVESSCLQTCTLNISGTTVTAGAILTVFNIAAIAASSVTALSATQALVTFHDDSAYYLRTCTLNISGTTVTAGAILTVFSDTSFGCAVTKLSATQALVAFRYGASSPYTLRACTLNISGTTVTAGTLMAVNTVSTANIAVTTLSATQAVVVYTNQANAFLQTCTLNISGTTVTAGGIITILTQDCSYGSVTTLSATQALVTYRNEISSYLQTCTLNISGTTVTAGAILTVNGVATTYTSVATLSATQAIVSYCGTSNYLQTCTLNISGTTVTAGAILTVNGVNSTYISLKTVSNTKAVVVYRGISNFLQSCILEVAL